MSLLIRTLVVVLLAAASNPVAARDYPRLVPVAGLNYGMPPQLYTVLSVDTNNSTIRLRAKDGRSGDVYVDSDIYDISKLKPGDYVRVDFAVPDPSAQGKLKAASVWPAGKK